MNGNANGSTVKLPLKVRPVSGVAVAAGLLGVWGGFAAIATDLQSSDNYGIAEGAAAVARMLVGSEGHAAVNLLWAMPYATIAVAGIMLLLLLSYRLVINRYPYSGASFDIAQNAYGFRVAISGSLALLCDYTLTIAASDASAIDISLTALAVPEHLRVFIKIPAAFCLHAGVTYMVLRGIHESAKILLTIAGVFFITLVAITGIVVWGEATTVNTILVESAQHAQQAGVYLTIVAALQITLHSCSSFLGLEAVTNAVDNLKDRQHTANKIIMILVVTTTLPKVLMVLAYLAYFKGNIPVTTDNVFNIILGQGLKHYISPGFATVILVAQIVTAVGILVAAHVSASISGPNLINTLANRRALPIKWGRLSNNSYVPAYAVIGMNAVSFIIYALCQGNTSSILVFYSLAVFYSIYLTNSSAFIELMKGRKEVRWFKLIADGIVHSVAAMVGLSILGVNLWERRPYSFIIVLVIMVGTVVCSMVASHYNRFKLSSKERLHARPFNEAVRKAYAQERVLQTVVEGEGATRVERIQEHLLDGGVDVLGEPLPPPTDSGVYILGEPLPNEIGKEISYIILAGSRSPSVMHTVLKQIAEAMHLRDGRVLTFISVLSLDSTRKVSETGLKEIKAQGRDFGEELVLFARSHGVKARFVYIVHPNVADAAAALVLYLKQQLTIVQTIVTKIGTKKRGWVQAFITGTLHNATGNHIAEILEREAGLPITSAPYLVEDIHTLERDAHQIMEAIQAMAAA